MKRFFKNKFEMKIAYVYSPGNKITLFIFAISKCYDLDSNVNEQVLIIV